MTHAALQDLLPCLRESFSYDPESGVVSWLNCAPRKSLNGQPAGYPDGNGRLRVGFMGSTIPVHHIAFALHHERLPVAQVDHINKIKTDNRACNLREATNAENSRNRVNSKPPKSGRKGVSLHRGRFIARIMVDGKAINLGSFNSADEAAAAYNEAATRLHGEFSCKS